MEFCYIIRIGICFPSVCSVALRKLELCIRGCAATSCVYTVFTCEPISMHTCRMSFSSVTVLLSYGL